MQEYLDKKTLAVQLSISPKTLQKELMGAMKDGCNAVLKIGKSYRIEPNGFISYLVNKNKSKSEEKQCLNQRQTHNHNRSQKIIKAFTKEEECGGFIIPKEESNIASHLRKRIYRMQ